MFAALTWWRGRQRAAPNLLLRIDSDAWDWFGGSPGLDSCDSVASRLWGTLTNTGDAPAHAIHVEASGATSWALPARSDRPGAPRGQFIERWPDLVPLLEHGDSVPLGLDVEAPLDQVTASMTWGQPPDAKKRRGPQRWRLADEVPDDSQNRPESA